MISNLRLFTGENTWALQHQLKRYIAAFRKKYPSGEVETFTAGAPLPQIQNAVFTNSLFSEKRLILLDHVFTADLYDAAEEGGFFTKIADADATVLLIDSAPDKRTRYYKKVFSAKSPIAKVEAFGLPKPNEMPMWAVTRAEQLGAKLQVADARLLVARCGTNPWRLDQELQKLLGATNFGAETITQELIEELTLPTPEADLWGFMELFSGKKPKAALDALEKLMNKGESPHALLGMMMREARIHALIGMCLTENMPDRDMASAIKLNPWVLKKTIGKTRALGHDAVMRLYGDLRSLDRRLKTGQVDQTGLAEELLLELERILIRFAT